ncbi:MAG: hypothetical protein AB7N71_02100 [Phycisphaerae bacterium]
MFSKQNRQRALEFALALLLGCTVAQAQQFELDWQTIDGGGESDLTGGAFVMHCTFGQHDASGPLTNPQFSMTGGFWAGVEPNVGGLVGDLNCDGFISVSDIGPFVLALTNPQQYAIQFPECDINNADTNHDGFVTVSDIGAFVALLTGG